MKCTTRTTFGAGDTTLVGVCYQTTSTVTGAVIPQDVTGWTFDASVYSDDGATVVGNGVSSVTAEISDANFAGGYVVISVPGSITDSISPGNYQLRVRATDLSGNNRTDHFLIALTNGGSS